MARFFLLASHEKHRGRCRMTPITARCPPPPPHTPPIRGGGSIYLSTNKHNTSYCMLWEHTEFMWGSPVFHPPCLIHFICQQTNTIPVTAFPSDFIPDTPLEPTAAAASRGANAPLLTPSRAFVKTPLRTFVELSTRWAAR